MVSYIYVFASRSESQAFHRYITSRGIRTTLINTPKECSMGCGLSVKVSNADYERSNYYLQQFAYKYTFKGIFRLESAGIKNIVTRVK